MRKKRNNQVLSLLLCLLLALALTACGGKKAEDGEEKINITMFAAISLSDVTDELIATYEKEHPDVHVVASYDSSGTLMEQIKEGAECDIFFSAAEKQMDELEEMGDILADTRKDVVNNQLCVVTYKGSNTKVTGLSDLEKAKSMALADGSVPVGRYTRAALVNAGKLQAADDVATIASEAVSEALGHLEINTCANAGAVTAAVMEGSNEVGTIYKSDTYGKDDQLEILEMVEYDLTGDVIYPIAQVDHKDVGDAQIQAAKDFIDFMISEEAKKVYQEHYFDPLF